MLSCKLSATYDSSLQLKRQFADILLRATNFCGDCQIMFHISSRGLSYVCSLLLEALVQLKLWEGWFVSCEQVKWIKWGLWDVWQLLPCSNRRIHPQGCGGTWIYLPSSRFLWPTLMSFQMIFSLSPAVDIWIPKPQTHAKVWKWIDLHSWCFKVLEVTMRHAHNLPCWALISW